MAARPGPRLGRVSRISPAGDVYVELGDVAPGFEFGPCLDTVGGLAVGDRIIAQGLARDEDELVITGLLGGPSADPYMIPLERLPVAPSGNANPTQIVRADDARLSDARTPTSHAHALADLPVAASGVSSATKLVRADDSRLTRPATAAGTVFIGTPGTAFVDVTYPAGRFTDYPIVSAICTASANVAMVANVGTNNATGVRFYLYGIGGAWTAGSLSIYWTATAAH